MQKVTILEMVYNKPDSATTRIVKRQRCRDKVFLQIFTIIAASNLLRISIWNAKLSHTHVEYMFMRMVLAKYDPCIP